MKKIIATVLCVVLACASIASVSAATQTDDSSTGLTLNDFLYTFRAVGEDTIPDNYARFYTFGTNSNTTSGIIITDLATSATAKHLFSFGSEPVSMYLPSTSGYDFQYTLSGGDVGMNCNRTPCFNKTGGTYEKLRVKLSAFSDYFNSDGTHTKDMISGESHDYNFTKEYTGGYTSHLIFISGGAITAVAPDRNGMAEIYFSTNIGQETFFVTDYSRKTDTSMSSGGGTTGNDFEGFIIGDVNKNTYVNVTDATLIQKYLANLTTFDDLSQRNADVDRDGKISVLDATAIQKYLAGII